MAVILAYNENKYIINLNILIDKGLSHFEAVP